jgi:hypothetical protein
MTWSMEAMSSKRMISLRQLRTKCLVFASVETHSALLCGASIRCLSLVNCYQQLSDIILINCSNGKPRPAHAISRMRQKARPRLCCTCAKVVISTYQLCYVR